MMGSAVEQEHTPRVRRWSALGTIVLCFVAAFEVVIMISPFAAFFYAVFNPVLLTLGQHPSTRWLTAFFLPHMIAAPDVFLAAIRIAGSILFVLGVLGFLVCAIQVYAGKLLKRGVASRGLYALIRHPQYASLGIAGVGLAILWPRFLTLVLLALMLFLYDVLARDEERRMLGRHGASYRTYMARTGMFLPRLGPGTRVDADERVSAPMRMIRALAVLVVLLIVVVGTGFALRAYTVRHLPMLSFDGVDAVAVTADDLVAVHDLLPGVLDDPAVAARLATTRQAGHRTLAYVIPVDYTMQGMIADTGEEWRLFERHQTIAMITDYVLHPFRHLTEGHAHGAMHTGSMHGHDSPAMKRRVILVDVSSPGRPLASPRDDFGLGVERRPRLFVDVHLHTGEVLQMRDIPATTGWGSVPTPTF
jgi:protein-S-isoprenylcysteine O-methyltransferase Ste14